MRYARWATVGLMVVAIFAGCDKKQPVAEAVMALREAASPSPDDDGVVWDGQHPVTLVFLTPDCPISNAYAPEIERIATDYGRRGVRFYRVYADSSVTAEQVAQHAKDFGYTFPGLRDEHHELVKLAGAKVTPEAVVLSPERKVLYRGRIDDRFVDFGKERAQVKEHDLRRALDAVLAGRPVPVAETEAIGCFIPGEE